MLERLRPTIDDTMDKLRRSTFREDPIADRKYSRATSIISSAYKRHGQIIDQAILERLKDCPRFKVWREDEFKLSHASLKELNVHQRVEKCLRIELAYGDRERAIPIDILVFDNETRRLTSYNIKRGNGSYDGGRRGIIKADLLRTNMHLLDYGKSVGIEPISAQAHIVFYYGLLSIPKPLAIAGSELDDHFSFPVIGAVEHVNSYFRRALHQLIEEE